MHHWLNPHHTNRRQTWEVQVRHSRLSLRISRRTLAGYFFFSGPHDCRTSGFWDRYRHKHYYNSNVAERNLQSISPWQVGRNPADDFGLWLRVNELDVRQFGTP